MVIIAVGNLDLGNNYSYGHFVKALPAKNWENEMSKPIIERNRENKFLTAVASDCIEYASQYNCSLAESVKDWEGDGPSGSWGLTGEEQNGVCVLLGIELFHDLLPDEY